MHAGYHAITQGNSFVCEFLPKFIHADILRQLDELAGYEANLPEF